MYHATNNLRVSTPVLIQILESNSFKITSDESGVFIYDSIYKENIYCPYTLIKQSLNRTQNKEYLYYLAITTEKDQDFDNKLAYDFLKIKIESAKELIDTLLYYKSIVYCCTKLSRVRDTVRTYIKEDTE